MCKNVSQNQMQMQLLMLQASSSSKTTNKGKPQAKGNDKGNNSLFFQEMMKAVAFRKGKESAGGGKKQQCQKGQGGQGCQQKQNPFMQGLMTGLQLAGGNKKGPQALNLGKSGGLQAMPINVAQLSPMGTGNSQNQCSCSKQNNGSPAMLIGLNMNLDSLGTGGAGASAPNNNKMIGFMF